jgi:hypothetical protein
VGETEHPLLTGMDENPWGRTDEGMKGIQNRQKPLVKAKDRKPREVVNFRKMNRELLKNWIEKVKKIQQ